MLATAKKEPIPKLKVSSSVAPYPILYSLSPPLSLSLSLSLVLFGEYEEVWKFTELTLFGIIQKRLDGICEITIVSI